MNKINANVRRYNLQKGRYEIMKRSNKIDTFIGSVLMLSIGCMTLTGCYRASGSENEVWKTERALTGYQISNEDSVVKCICDIDRDGTEEVITADYSSALSDSQAPIPVEIREENGSVIYSDSLGLPHTAWKNLYIVTVDGYPCLMEYNGPEESQGTVYYNLEIFRFDENGQKIVLEEQSGMGEAGVEEFQSLANQYLDQAKLFVSTWDFEITHYEE